MTWGSFLERAKERQQELDFPLFFFLLLRVLFFLFIPFSQTGDNPCSWLGNCQALNEMCHRSPILRKQEKKKEGKNSLVARSSCNGAKEVSHFSRAARLSSAPVQRYALLFVGSVRAREWSIRYLRYSRRAQSGPPAITTPLNLK